MASINDRLKEIILRDQLVNEKELERVFDELRKSGGSLSKILSKRELIDDNALVQILSEASELPIINISRFQIDPEATKIIPLEIVLKYTVFPVSLIGDNLTLATADVLDVVILDNIKARSGCIVSPVLGRRKDIEQAIAKQYAVDKKQMPVSEGTDETFEEIMEDIKEVEDIELVKEALQDQKKSAVEEISSEGPIIKLTDTIIQQAVLAKASDIFIEPLEKALRIRYRVDGVIREIDRMAKVLHFPIISRIKVISNLDISEHRLPQDGRFRIITSGHHEVDFRVNVLPTVIGEKAVLRVLDKDASYVNIDKLGFEEESLKRLKECAHKPHGMILACGPTGSGKTTTLYSILKYVDSPGHNIVTVEDPVEFQLKGLNQVNIKPNMGLTFPTALRSILRQDPDIIMIGEIRDSETLDIAVKAALTGHLVLSSLHTTTAAGSIVRMMNMGIEPFLICSSVLAMVAQRLLRRICEYCKETYELPEAVAEKVGLRQITSQKKNEFFKGKGCKKCLNSGYKGRVGITEVLIVSQKIKEAILNRAGEIKIKEIARQEGMRTMREDGLAKALAGLTSLEEVLRVTVADEAKK